MLDILVAAPREIAIGGKPYKIGALKLLELGYLQRWIRDHAGEAPGGREDWPPSFHSMEGTRILFGDLEGQLYFLGVFFRKHQPELTDQDIQAIAGAIGDTDFWTFWSVAVGSDDLDPEAARASVTEFKKLQAAVDAQQPAPLTGSSSRSDG